MYACKLNTVLIDSGAICRIKPFEIVQDWLASFIWDDLIDLCPCYLYEIRNIIPKDTLTPHLYRASPDGDLSSMAVVKEQWPMSSSSELTTPHRTGRRWASWSSSGAWQAALITALQVDNSGRARSPFGYRLKNPVITKAITSIQSKLKDRMIPIGENPARDASAIFTLFSSYMTIRTRNRACEMNQCKRPEHMIKGMLYL